MCITDMLGSVGLPPGVDEDNVDSLSVNDGVITLYSTERLPPRYHGIRRLPPFTPREVAASDEQYVSWSTGACGTIAKPRRNRVEWVHDGESWKRT